MKKVLFIATTDLNRKDGGGLGMLGHFNSCKFLTKGNVDLVMPAEARGVQFANAIGAPRRPIVKSLLSGSIHRYKSFLKRYLSKHKDVYELCIVNGGIYAGDMMDMLHSYGIKVVVFHLNYEPDYQMDNKSLWTLNGRTDFFVKRNERRAYLKADYNCFMTETDQSLFIKNYGKVDVPCSVIGCYETRGLQNKVCEFPKSIKPALSITGSMNTLQTLCGIRDFRDRYFKIFKEICPEWKVIISGRNPVDEIMEFEKASNKVISVIPNPENMDDIIKQSTLFLCPTNVGGGIKVRVMDGLKQGRPVLVHQISARGYESLFREPFFKVYYDEDTFRSGLKSLLEYTTTSLDPNDIYKKYLQYFSFEAGTSRYNDIFNVLKSL